VGNFKRFNQLSMLKEMIGSTQIQVKPEFCMRKMEWGGKSPRETEPRGRNSTTHTQSSGKGQFKERGSYPKETMGAVTVID